MRPTTEESFNAQFNYQGKLSLVEGEESHCHEWTGTVDKHGYGQTRWASRYKTRSPQRTHRIKWELENGPVPEGKGVLHKCDNPPCGNTKHLFLGTQKDNVRDMLEKGRDKPKATHCIHGHELTAENIYIRPSDKLHRECRQCRRIKGGRL